uniref:Uncharacterized protein n=1 Tax=Tetranychus urticae TaxID=32264 RepID=T1KRS4_TETUR
MKEQDNKGMESLFSESPNFYEPERLRPDPSKEINPDLIIKTTGVSFEFKLTHFSVTMDIITGIGN